jgi:predicted lipoprotein with Yx(FWY)xxD motif
MLWGPTVIQSPKCTSITVGKAGAEQSLSTLAVLTACAKPKRNEMREMNDTKHANKAREALRKIRLVPLAGAVLAVGGLSSSVAVASAAGAATSTVSTTKTAKFGTILVSGRTVYTLKPSKVACGAQCLKIWPEVLLPKGVTTTTAGPGVSAARLGTVSGTGGSRQVTYRGKPLYYFFNDTRPGQVNGNLTDKWGKWSVVVTVKPAHPSSGSGGSPTTSAGSGGVSF